MTPLAHRIVKDMMLPSKRRKFRDKAAILGLMPHVHCFEVSEVLPLARALAADMPRMGRPATAQFLPAEQTWIEWNEPGRGRYALLLNEPEGVTLEVSACYEQGFRSEGWYFNSEQARLLTARNDPEGELRRQILNDNAVKWARQDRSSEFIAALLAIINTPRIIGRKQHMPHRGLEKALAREKGLIGSFPLRAWTELTLPVSEMMTEADGTVHEAHYTGEKCLHFCRAHLRVRNGRLEQVKAHWRGNPALGVKQTRYKVVA